MKKLNRYRVEVVRRYYSVCTVDVKAKDMESAKDIAEDLSGNLTPSLNLEDVEIHEITLIENEPKKVKAIKKQKI